VVEEFSTWSGSAAWRFSGNRLGAPHSLPISPNNPSLYLLGWSSIIERCSAGTLSHPFSVFMDLLGLNLQFGIGVQTVTHHRFGEPVNFFPVSGLKEFFLLFQLVGASTLGGVVADFMPQLISDECLNLLWLL
jgi:hypothetical protein